MKQPDLPFDIPKAPEHPLVTIMTQLPGTLEYALGLVGVRPEHQFKAAQALLQGEVTPELKKAAEHFGHVKLP